MEEVKTWSSSISAALRSSGALVTNFTFRHERDDPDERKELPREWSARKFSSKCRKRLWAQGDI